MNSVPSFISDKLGISSADIEVIVVSAPGEIENEAVIIELLFKSGLRRFHLRKPGWSKEQKISLLEQIDGSYHGLISVHITSQDDKWSEWKGSWHGTGEQSCSIHAWEEYEKLPVETLYCFIGPVFDSISKPGYLSNRSLMDVPAKSHVRLIAIGGVTVGNFSHLMDLGYDGVALLGSIWQNEPVWSFKSFINLKQVVQ